MATTFNPFNPFAYWTAALAPLAPVKRDTTPIAIDARSSDPGMRIKTGKNEVTLKGTTAGFKQVEVFGGLGGYELARGVSFTLDIDKAKTTDAFGRTDYTEKNSRLFGLTTSKGWTAEESAKRLAAKVNAEDDFRARVTVHKDGSATIAFERR